MNNKLNNHNLWIVSPCYLDLHSFLLLRSKILEELILHKIDSFQKINFVIVDDSGDQDEELKKNTLPADTLILSPPFNLGHQRAIVYGLRKLINRIFENDFIVTMDSDGEDKPNDLPKILQVLIDNITDIRKIVIAQRTKRKESITFKLLYIAFKIMFHLLTGKVIRSGNFAAFRGWTIRHIISHPHFDICYSSSLISLNLNPEYIPCARGTRFHGKSKMNLAKLILHGIRMLLPFLDRIAIRSLIFLTITILLSSIFASLIVVLKALTSYQIPDWMYINLCLSIFMSLISIGQFIILITIVAQSQGIALSNLDKDYDKNNTAL